MMVSPVLSEFKLELERQFGFINWSPTEQDLIGIAREILRGRVNTRDSLSKIVLRIFPGTLVLAQEGADNSDLRVLLALAAKAATKG